MADESKEESKTLEQQLQDLKKQYPEITEVQINKDIINKLLTNIYTSSNFGQKIEGLIYGRVTEKNLSYHP